MPRVKSLYLRNFRNFSEAEFSFSEGVNVIWGDNAQGKTNLLEAISLIAIGRSFRTEHLSEAIRKGTPFFHIEVELIQNDVSQLIKLSFDGQNKRLQINSSTYTSFTPLLGTLPLILYTPGDIELISGAPGGRRRFLNLHLAQCDPLYVHHFSRFWRAMKQRNCLLRTENREPIDCWEVEMANAAAYLFTKRKCLIEELQPPLSAHASAFSSDELHELRYHPSSSENHYLQLLQKNRKRDKDLGMTTAGPHRDDLSFWIGNALVKTYGSEGQKKTAIASLRLAEWDRLSARLLCAPLMAVDDLGLALDEKRQTHFRSKLKQLGQVFITTPFSISPSTAHHIRIQDACAQSI